MGWCVCLAREEREAGLEAAEATAEAKTMDVEHFQETFPKVQHDQAEMEEEEEREHVAHAQDAEMDVEEKREHAAHAAQEEQENEEKALHEAEASFPAPGDTSEAVDESTEHKALQDAEVSFPEPLADDDEESRGKEEEAHSTYTRTAEGGVEKAHVDTANLVRLSLKVPMDAQSFTPELRETFVGAIAKVSLACHVCVSLCMCVRRGGVVLWTHAVVFYLVKACGEVWCGVVWCGVVWCGVVWCGVVW